MLLHTPLESWQPSRSEFVSRRQYIALLMMLTRRATWRDRIAARFKPEHWLNSARHDVENYVIGEWSAR